ncbi:unnamed protein product [Aphanomyces euteiches]
MGGSARGGEKTMKEEVLPLVVHDADVSIDPVKHTRRFVVSEVKVLLELIGPVVFTLVNEYIPAVTNIVLVGHSISPNVKEQVDATLLNITSMSTALGLASAMDTLCTQAFGAGNHKKFGEYLQGAILGMALFLVPVCLINWYSEAILVFLGQDPVISAMAGVFIRWSTIGMPFLCAYELIKRLLQAHQITTPPAIVSLLGNVIHVAAGYYLIHYSSWGFYGAAVGRSVAYVSLPFLMLPYFYWHPIHLEWNLRWKWTEAWANLPLFLEFGMPGMVSLVVEWGAFEILTLMSGLMADHTIALGVNSILMTIISIVYMPFWGVSTGACIRIGYYLGANKPVEAKISTYVSYALSTCCCLISGAALFFTRNFLPALFVNDVDMIQRTSFAVLFLIPCHMIDSMNSVTTGVLRAMGKQQVGVVILMSAYYIVGIPMAALCAFYLDWSVEGLWVGFTFGTAAAYLSYIYQLRTTNWRHLAQAANTRSM